jgi:hypothetical protein
MLDIKCVLHFSGALIPNIFKSGGLRAPGVGGCARG